MAIAQDPPEKPASSGKPPPSSNQGCLRGCIIGGIFALVMLLSCGGVIYYAISKSRSIAGNVARTVIVQAIKASELPGEEQEEVIVQVDRVVDAYKKGEIDTNDLQNILHELSRSPIMSLAILYGLEKQYLDMSGLTVEEKIEARKQIQRFMRGAMEDSPGGNKKISHTQVDALIQPLIQTGPKGEQQLKQLLTDQELRNFVMGAKKLADDAMIPDQVLGIDVGQEAKRIVDQGLAKGGH